MAKMNLGSVSALLMLVAAPLAAAPCAPSDTALCLNASRFQIGVHWEDPRGRSGDGHAVALTADTGYFWFFTPANVELVVKVLDGRGLNGHFWVFYGALSNVQYTLTVRDSQTGEVQTYDNAAGQFGSRGDTTAFPLSGTVRASRRSSAAVDPSAHFVDEAEVAPSPEQAGTACTPGPTSLCLSGGRFRVEASWKDFHGRTGEGHAVGLTPDTGYFWFFSDTNVEAIVKVLDGRALNDSFWVFYGALSNVEYTLTVTDTETGIVKRYSNPPGLFASIGDTGAFGKPTTFQLIDGAVVKGEIDDETALVHKVYAFFGDPSLPAKYDGAPPGKLDHGILREVVARWATLSPATQQLLAAYLAPPTEAGSWFAGGSATIAKAGAAVADTWTKIPTNRAVVWYRASDPNAQTAAGNLAGEIENIWTKETDLMGRQPLSDAGNAHNGGDGKLDIYVLPSFRDPPGATEKTEALGVTVAYPDSEDNPAYILIRASYAATIEGARDVLAHEFFHTLAFASTYKFGIDVYGWLDEATATWMEDYVYPTQIKNLEQDWAPDYFKTGSRDTLAYPSDGGYSEYLFFFYVARKFNPAVNAQIWNNVAGMDSTAAIESAIPGGFQARWPDFALACWNDDGHEDFKQWDSLTGGLIPNAAQPFASAESADGSRTIPSLSVEPLAMRYSLFETDLDTIKRVAFQVPKLAQGSSFAKIQALVKLADGTTRLEDWTKKERVVFCRDKDGQKVVKVLMLYTNGNSDSTGPAIVWNDGKIEWDSIGCGYHGTVHVKLQTDDLDETTDVTAAFVHVPDGDFGNTVQYASGEYTVRYQGTQENAGCTDSVGPVSHTFSGNDAFASLLTFDTSTSPPGYSAACAFFFEATETSVCPDGTTQHPAAAVGLWWMIPAGQFKVKPDGSLADTYTDDEGRVYTWSFQPDTGGDGSQ
jgi:hypothetical protein